MKISPRHRPVVRQSQWLYGILLGLWSFMPLVQSSELHVERVLGPEVDTGLYKHPSTFEVLDNGDFYAAYYGGGGEYAWNTAVYGTRRLKGETAWSEPVAIASNPFQSMGNPVLWQAPGGDVWLFFVVRFGDTWSSSRIMAKISRDRCESWSDAFPITFEEGTMVRSRPIVLQNGGYLLPIYHETGRDTEKTGADTSSLFLRLAPGSRSWKASNKVYSRLGNLQPAVVPLGGDHYMAFCRRGGDYEPGDDGYVIRTESQDGGRTWSQGVETTFPNPNAAVELIRLANGHLLFVYNHSMDDRTPLRAALSLDGGMTFPFKRDIMAGEGSYAYPTALQTPEGRIHVMFTSNDRTTIRLATFEESFLLSGD